MIKICRVCKSIRLSKIGSLGKIAISDFTSKPLNGHKDNLTLVYCGNCKLLQLDHNPYRDTIYRKNYWYKSNLNSVIVDDLHNIVDEILPFKRFKTNDIWIDIGANDGTLLSFVPKKFTKMAVDPGKAFRSELKQHSDQCISDYWEIAKLGKTKAEVITAIACLYDLPDPHYFVSKIKDTLAQGGIFVCQLMTLVPMIENNDVGNICHEHIEFYSYRSLQVLFEMHGLEIFWAKVNKMNGGSYRLFIRHTKGVLPTSFSLDEKEYTVKDLKDFFKRIKENKDKFLKWSKGKKIYGYGASTKGNTILQYYGLTNKQIAAMVDINPKKKGKYTIGSKIPIIDKTPKDGYLWVLPYGFVEHFMDREPNHNFVVTIPKFKVYDNR